MKHVYWLGIAFILLAVAIQIWLKNRNDQGAVTQPSTAAIETHGSGRLEPEIRAIGFVEPVGEIRRLVFRAEGVIGRCRAEVGRNYEKGNVLMELDNSEELAAVNVAESELRLTEAERDKVLSGVNPYRIAAAAHRVEVIREQIRYWSREHERFAALVPGGAASRAEFDRSATETNQRRTELKQAEADLDHLRNYVRFEDKRLSKAKVAAAKAKLQIANRRYDATILRAPANGMVLEILRREGESSRISDSEPAVVFGDTSALRIRAEVDERYVATIQAGQPVFLFGRGLGHRQYSGKIAIVNPMMGKKTVFTRSATERKDLDVVQVLIDVDRDFRAPVGLQVDLIINP
jgi:HlyD family secretion protein